MTAAACLVLGFWVLVALDWKRRWPGEIELRGAASRGRGASRCEPGPSGHGSPPSGSPGSLLVVVPARNEAASLPSTLPALLEQSGSFSRLVLVDDRSEDETREVAAALAAASPEPLKVLVVKAEPPAAGWTGKLHALRSGILAAGGPFEWLLFTDADIRHPPGSIAALVEKAASEARDLVSVMVRLRAEGFWEKLLIPPFVWFFQLLYPFRRVADPRSRVAAAAGGCLLVRSSALERAGGLEAIRGRAIDDVSLARQVKRAGGSCWLGLEAEMLSLRGYGSLGEVTRMVARTAFEQLGHRYSLVLGTILFLGLFFAGPPVLAALGAATLRPAVAAAAGAAWLIESAAFLPAVLHHRVSPLYCLTLPAASLLYAYMTAASAWRHLRGRGVEWRGRRIGGERG